MDQSRSRGADGERASRRRPYRRCLAGQTPPCRASSPPATRARSRQLIGQNRQLVSFSGNSGPDWSPPPGLRLRSPRYSARRMPLWHGLAGAKARGGPPGPRSSARPTPGAGCGMSTRGPLRGGCSLPPHAVTPRRYHDLDNEAELGVSRMSQVRGVGTRPSNKRMQLTKLRAAPVLPAEVPPCAPAGRTDGGTASQLIRSVRQTWTGVRGETRQVVRARVCL